MKILTAGDILGLFEESFQKFGYMHIIGDQRTAIVHDFFRGAFIRGNNFVFNPESNSLLFRKFLP